MICPGPHTSPGLMTLRLRISQPLMPTSAASRSMTPSMANCAWLAPKPRNAPHTGLLVRTAMHSTSIDGTRYGPLAWPAARSSTFIPTLAYEPESPMPRTRSAVSLPSESQPAQYSSRIGWRLAWIRKLSSRDSVHFTGRCSSQAASAVCPWLLMSSLPPNAPPLDTSSTVTCSLVNPSSEAIWSRSSHTPWPPEYTCRSPLSVMTASVLSGSRKACSMRWVWNTSCTVCAAERQPRVDVAARVHAARQHVGVGAVHGDLRVVDRRDRIGDRPVHVVGDVDQRRRVRGPAGGSRRRRSPARRRRTRCAGPRR